MKAQIKRLTELDILPQDHATYLYKLYLAKGWSREEPFDRAWDIPSPKAISDALNLIVEAGLRTKADLLSMEFTMHASDVENISGLPAGWFSRESGQVVQLKADRPNDQSVQLSEAVILTFKQRS